MRVPGPVGCCSAAGLCARERAVGVDERNSSMYLDVYELNGVLEDVSAASKGLSKKEVGLSGVDRFGVLDPVADKGIPSVAFLACLPATLGVDRRISNVSSSSPATCSSIALDVFRCLEADADDRSAWVRLVTAGEEEFEAPLPPLARTRKMTLDVVASSSSSTSSGAIDERRGVAMLGSFRIAAELEAPFCVGVGLKELLDGPAPASSSSS